MFSPSSPWQDGRSCPHKEVLLSQFPLLSAGSGAGKGRKALLPPGSGCPRGQGHAECRLSCGIAVNNGRFGKTSVFRAGFGNAVKSH